VNDECDDKNVRNRLLEAGSKLFLEKDFHSVSLREIALEAGTTGAMISYYFKSKHGLFEEMVIYQYGKIINTFAEDALEGKPIDHIVVMKRVMKIYRDNPGLAHFIVKTSAIQSGPGSQFLREMFHFEKDMTEQLAQEHKRQGIVRQEVDVEVMRILSICVTIFPAYMADGLRSLYGNDEEYDDFENRFINVVGSLLRKAVYHDHVKFE
jgi:AcrR family transcriptional regulator